MWWASGLLPFFVHMIQHTTFEFTRIFWCEIKAKLKLKLKQVVFLLWQFYVYRSVLLLLVYKKGQREIEARDRQGTWTFWFIPGVLAIAGETGPGPHQELQTQLVPHSGAKHLITWAVICCLPGCRLAGSWNWKQIQALSAGTLVVNKESQVMS